MNETFSHIENCHPYTGISVHVGLKEGEEVGRERGRARNGKTLESIQLPFWTAFVYINRERAHGVAIFQQCTVDIHGFFQRRENSKRTPGGRGEVR